MSESSIPSICVVNHAFCQYTFDPAVKVGSSQLHPAVRKTANASTCVSIKHIPKSKSIEFLHLEGVVHHKLSKAPHPNLPLLLEAFEDRNGEGYVVQSQYDRDLHSHIRTTGRFSEQDARMLFRQLVSAVHHCHTLRIVLRDIKLGKILFTNSQRTDIVIADLDGAQEVSATDPLLFDQKGSPAYVSPEVLTCQPYDGAAADMWTLGVVLYVMLTGSYPFQDKRPANLFQKIQLASEGLCFPNFVSDPAKILIKKLLSKQPSARPTAAQVLEDPWMDHRPQESPALFGWLQESSVEDTCLTDQLVPGASLSSSRPRSHKSRRDVVRAIARSLTAPYSASSRVRNICITKVQQPPQQPQQQQQKQTIAV